MDLIGLIGGKLLEALLPALATALAGVAVAVLVKLFKKIGLEVDEKQREAVKTTVRDAILAVEEQARQTPMTSDTKHEIATAIVKRELPAASDAAIHLQLRAALPEVRETLGQSPIPQPSTPGTFGRPKTPEELAARP
jgi:hypothetical protein